MRGFIKKVLRQGVSMVNRYNPEQKTWGKQKQAFTTDRFQKMVDGFQQMKTSGHLIPAPPKHDGSGPIKKEEHSDSLKNNGFWDNLWIGEDGDLYGLLHVENPDIAGKIGTSVKEVSPYILDKYTDGDGNVFKDAFAHIALVTHPVQPGQSNFQPVDSNPGVTEKAGQYAVAMSDYVCALSEDTTGDYSSGDEQPPKAKGPNPEAVSVSTVVQALARHGICLPETTNAENLLERILIACYALDGAEEDEDEELTEPTGSKEQPRPIAMSSDTPAEPSPTSPQATAMSELSPQERRLQKLTAVANDTAKNALAKRIESLVANDILTKDKAIELFEHDLEGFQLSFDPATDEPLPSLLEVRIQALEAANPPKHNPFTGEPLTANRTPQTQKTAGSLLSQQLHAEEQPDYNLGDGSIITDGDDLDKAVQAQLNAPAF